MTYKAITINGESHIQAVNTFHSYYEPLVDDFQKIANKLHAGFNITHPPILWIDPAIHDGTLLDESEVSFVWQKRVDNVWEEAGEISLFSDETRRVATRKENTDTCFIDPSVDYTFSYDPKNCTGTYTPAEEGEQPMKQEQQREESLTPEDKVNLIAHTKEMTDAVALLAAVYFDLHLEKHISLSYDIDGTPYILEFKPKVSAPAQDQGVNTLQEHRTAESFYEESFYDKEYDKKHKLLSMKQRVCKIMEEHASQFKTPSEGWVSVEEGLPAIGTMILYYDNDIYKGFF